MASRRVDPALRIVGSAVDDEAVDTDEVVDVADDASDASDDVDAAFASGAARGRPSTSARLRPQTAASARDSARTAKTSHDHDGHETAAEGAGVGMSSRQEARLARQSLEAMRKRQRGRLSADHIEKLSAMLRSAVDATGENCGLLNAMHGLPSSPSSRPSSAAVKSSRPGSAAAAGAG
eukprot:CAMPEP_0174831996 /NCGR_PEP_ID=MMETSP1114-20130205/3424_1 /TAXON_ID=312471 /ORGANISM="Neobodo designis, Strain CCAP 1951/1" /LENGTH=178 /DNA_ID=CAMNT_0016065845 /DNA_START=40 /DNA_END=572 /DNA_ORIENTATION=+